jgi:hypothetical protein
MNSRKYSHSGFIKGHARQTISPSIPAYVMSDN